MQTNALYGAFWSSQTFEVYRGDSTWIVSLAASRFKLQAALSSFRDALTPHDRGQFQSYQTYPVPHAVMRLTAEVDAKQAHSRQRCIGTRLQYFLDSVQQFSSIVDTFVSSNPNTAALIWGSVKFTILVAMNISPYLQKTTQLFMDLKDLYPRFSAYQLIYRDYPRVQTALCDFYAELVECCRVLVLISGRQGFVDTIKSAVWPFESELNRFRANIGRLSNSVKEEINLATVQSAIKDQELQALERKAATKLRDTGNSFFQRSAREDERTRQWQIAREAREADLRKQALLSKLSSHNQFLDYKRARVKQHGDTAGWVVETEAFKDWILGDQESVLWFSGKLGTGKTVATANVVNHLRCREYAKSSTVSIFFCRFDDHETLTAVKVLSSLLRQYLEINEFDVDAENQLSKLLKYSTVDLEDVINCWKALANGFHTLIIDGIDECLESEQILLLNALAALICLEGTKLFLASRDSLRLRIEKRLARFHHVSADFPAARPSISTYIDIRIDEAYRNMELVVGSPTLLETIKDEPKTRAKGMFLWVAFQVDEICAQTSDADILEALENLPRDLPETYARITARIAKSSHFEIMREIFAWVIAAKEPLTLQQLREATAIYPCQPYTMPERLRNDLFRVIEWSRSLLILDEEDSTVQLTHPSVRQFFLDNTESSKPFKMDEMDQERKIGKICVTYLNFSDFKTTLTKPTKGGDQVLPEAIATQILTNEVNKPISKLAQQLWRFKAVSKAQYRKNIIRMLEDASRRTADNVFESHIENHFLSYASRFWLLHTQDITPTDEVYRIWVQLLHSPEGLTKRPWDIDAFEHRLEVCEYIGDQDHAALLRYIEASTQPLSVSEFNVVTSQAFQKGSRRVLALLLQTRPVHFCTTIQAYLAPYLPLAVDETDLLAVDRLLHFGTSPNLVFKMKDTLPNFLDLGPSLTILSELWPHEAQASGLSRIDVVTSSGRVDVKTGEFTPLTAAIRRYHQHIAIHLIEAGALVNGLQSNGRETPLAMAARWGNSALVEKLLAAGASPNDDRLTNTMTPLMAAMENGHTGIVNQLIAAGASVNEYQRESTLAEYKIPLMASIMNGRKDICRLLLNAGANTEVIYDSLSPLTKAIDLGYHEIACLLLTARADPNYPYDARRTSPLALATAKGANSVVGALIKAGAKLNWQGSGADYQDEVQLKGDSGIGALHAASAYGRSETAQMLLEAGADPGILTLKGRNPFHLAALLSSAIMMSILYSNSFPRIHTSNAVAFALYKAAQDRDRGTVQFLLSTGADPNWSHYNDEDALAVAQKNGK